MKFTALCYLSLYFQTSQAADGDIVPVDTCLTKLNECYSEFTLPEIDDPTVCASFEELESNGVLSTFQCMGSAEIKSACADNSVFESIKEGVALIQAGMQACPEDCASCTAFQDSLQMITGGVVPVDTCLTKLSLCSDGEPDIPQITDPTKCANFDGLESNGALSTFQCIGTSEIKSVCADSSPYKSIQEALKIILSTRLDCPKDCKSCTALYDALQAIVGEDVPVDSCFTSFFSCMKKFDQAGFEAAISKVEKDDTCGIIAAGKSSGQLDALKCVIETVLPNCKDNEMIQSNLDEVKKGASECPKECTSDCAAILEIINEDPSTSAAIATVTSFNLISTSMLVALKLEFFF